MPEDAGRRSPLRSPSRMSLGGVECGVSVVVPPPNGMDLDDQFVETVGNLFESFRNSVASFTDSIGCLPVSPDPSPERDLVGESGPYKATQMGKEKTE